MRRTVLPVVILLSASSLPAQSLESGTPLRAHAQVYTVTGALVRWNADSLVLRPGGRGGGLFADRSIATADILRLERKAPRSRGRGAARGALWGTVIGTVVGGVAGAADDCYDSGNAFLCPDSRFQGFLIGGALIGAPGALIGTLVGAIRPGERWRPVEWRPSTE